MHCVFSEALELVQGDCIWMIWLLDFSRNFQKLQIGPFRRFVLSSLLTVSHSDLLTWKNRVGNVFEKNRNLDTDTFVLQ